MDNTIQVRMSQAYRWGSQLTYVQMIVPCETNVTVTMTLAGVPFNIFPNTYNLGAVAGSNNDCMGAFVTTVNGKQKKKPSLLFRTPFSSCRAENLILGTSFMRNVYTEFHLDSSAVAFAQVSVTE